MRRSFVVPEFGIDLTDGDDASVGIGRPRVIETARAERPLSWFEVGIEICLSSELTDAGIALADCDHAHRPSHDHQILDTRL